MTHSAKDLKTLLSIGVLVGLAGGLAEIVWVGAFAAATPLHAASVARGVTETVFPALGAAPFAVILGIALHMIIAVPLGMALAIAMRWVDRNVGGAAPVVGLAAGVLMIIWTMNFFVVLPVVNPEFITLLPYAVSAASKALFALSSVAVYLAFYRDGIGRRVRPFGKKEGLA